LVKWPRTNDGKLNPKLTLPLLRRERGVLGLEQSDKQTNQQSYFFRREIPDSRTHPFSHHLAFVSKLALTAR
jgi:hypothetical protein